MSNLLQETIEILEYHGKTLSDIIFIRQDHHYKWDQPACNHKIEDLEALKLLLDTEYDDGYGSPEVNTNLQLVGKDFWLERHEYDGSEWWEYKTLPTYDESIACDLTDIKIWNSWED